MSFFTALSGLNAAQADISVTSNNIANVGTIGFHGSRAEFGDIYSRSLYSNPKTTIGSGTRMTQVSTSFAQGTVASSANMLDMAVDGPGFFRLQSQADGGTSMFTRAGAFQMDKDGYIVNPQGMYLSGFAVNPDGTAIPGGTPTAMQVPATLGGEPLSGAIEVDDAGILWASYGANDAVALGRVAMGNFTSLQGLRHMGDASYSVTGDSGAPMLGGGGDPGFGLVRAGALEQANVDLTNELVHLITTQRNYQASAKALETNSQISQTIMNMRS